MVSVDADVPESIAELWSQVEEARLFEDKQYGQWGLVLLSFERAKARTAEYYDERQRDAIDGDLIVGEFLGVSDLLLVRSDRRAADFGQIIVVDPLDRRADWCAVGSSLASFLERFERAEGRLPPP